MSVKVETEVFRKPEQAPLRGFHTTYMTATDDKGQEVTMSTGAGCGNPWITIYGPGGAVHVDGEKLLATVIKENPWLWKAP